MLKIAVEPTQRRKGTARQSPNQSQSSLNAETQRNAEKRRDKELSATFCTAIVGFVRRLRRSFWNEINRGIRGRRTGKKSVFRVFRPSSVAALRRVDVFRG